MTIKLALDLDEIEVQTLDIADDQQLSLESLVGGHAMAELAASCEVCSCCAACCCCC